MKQNMQGHGAAELKGEPQSFVFLCGPLLFLCGPLWAERIYV